MDFPINFQNLIHKNKEQLKNKNSGAFTTKKHSSLIQRRRECDDGVINIEITQQDISPDVKGVGFIATSLWKYPRGISRYNTYPIKDSIQ